MNKLKFNSQVCTTKEQGLRLLDLGLKPETADMFLFDNMRIYTAGVVGGVENNATLAFRERKIPAWSLHRLLEMICNKECKKHYYFDLSVDYDSMEDVYNSIIEVIERHIKENRFNKEYLKQ